MEAARDAVAGAGLGQVAGLMGAELAVGLGYGIAGYVVFRYLENWSRRGGLQEAY